MMNWVELTAVGGFGIAIATLVWKVVANGQNDRKRIYARIDEERARADGMYVHKDVCSERHFNITEDLKEIKLDIKELLKRKGGERSG